MNTDSTTTLQHAGCSLAYRVTGDGEPVILIQGVGVHGDGWDPQVQGLKHRYRCLTFDNRGMALSQPAGCRITVSHPQPTVRRVLDVTGVHGLFGLV